MKVKRFYYDFNQMQDFFAGQSVDKLAGEKIFETFKD